MLVEYLESRSRWRDEKAEQYPDDLRNGRSADALASLAAYVRDGRADASVVDRIETPSREDGTGILQLTECAADGEHPHGAVARYGFYFALEDPAHDHEQFLALLADLVEKDEAEQLMEWVREGACSLDDVPDRIRLTVELRLADIERYESCSHLVPQVPVDH
jgi:hypothetical protein